MSRSRKKELYEENSDEGERDACHKNLNGERAGKDWTIEEIRVGRIATGRTQVSGRKGDWGIRRTHRGREKEWAGSFLGNLMYSAWRSWPAPNSHNPLLQSHRQLFHSLNLTTYNGVYYPADGCVQPTPCLSLSLDSPRAFPTPSIAPCHRFQ